MTCDDKVVNDTLEWESFVGDLILVCNEMGVELVEGNVLWVVGLIALLVYCNVDLVVLDWFDETGIVELGLFDTDEETDGVREDMKWCVRDWVISTNT